MPARCFLAVAWAACAGSPSRGTTRSPSRGPASATASTAPSPRTRRTSARPEEVEGLLDEALKRNAKELLVLTGERPEVNPVVAAKLAEWGHDDFTSYVVWSCERALERGMLPAHEHRRARPRRSGRAAGGHRVPGPDAGVGLRAPDGDRPRWIADQASGAAAGDDRGCGRAEDPVHERDPGWHRRDRGGAGRIAGSAGRAARTLRAHPGGDPAELRAASAVLRGGSGGHCRRGCARAVGGRGGPLRAGLRLSRSEYPWAGRVEHGDAAFALEGPPGPPSQLGRARLRRRHQAADPGVQAVDAGCWGAGAAESVGCLG